MSWSVSSIGKPAAVKAALAKQFVSAKTSTQHIPAEQESVGIAEQFVNNQLDFAVSANVGAIKVICSGSASTASSGYSGSVQSKIEVESLYNFVE